MTEEEPKPIYMDGKREAAIGDVVMIQSLRCVVIGINGPFVKVLGIWTKMDTGETFVLNPRYIHDHPASVCHYLEKQTLTL